MSKGESKPDYKAGGIIMHPVPGAMSVRVPVSRRRTKRINYLNVNWYK